MFDQLKAFYPLGNTSYEAEMRIKTRMALVWIMLFVAATLLVSRMLCE